MKNETKSRKKVKKNNNRKQKAFLLGSFLKSVGKKNFSQQILFVVYISHSKSEFLKKKKEGDSVLGMQRFCKYIFQSVSQFFRIICL